MTNLFVLLFLLSIVGLIWGLIAPHHIARITPGRRELTRKHTGIGFMALVFTFLILVAVSNPSQKNINTKQASLTTHDQPSASSLKSSTQVPSVTTQQQTQTQPVPYTTQDQYDSSLAKGQTKVAQVGENGTETLTYKVTFTNDTQTSRTLLSTIVTTQPVNEVVDVGTYIAPTPTPIPAESTPSTPTPAPSESCYPLSDEDTCYEPGEYCRDSDHGANGLAGDGESIACEENNGWRWEPN
jgi:hypothetical protein